MKNTAALRDALLWAAGNDASPFTLRPDQYDTFLEAVRLHRLVGRLLRRLQGDPQAVTPQLVDEAVRIHEAIKADTYQKIDLADRLGKAVRAAGRDEYLVLLKGFTLYALTGDPLTLRTMGDLDVIVSDLDGFVDIAKRMGFQIVRRLDHLAEYAVLNSSSDGIVELHSRFDVTSLPPGLSHKDLDPGLHVGVWEQHQHFCVRYLRHADFKEYIGVSSVVPDTVRPLGAEMAALVNASHMFKNFLRCPYPLPVATIPLDEIATFVDLCRLPSFDASRFAQLVDDFEGQTAVSFSRALAKELLGADQLPGDPHDRLFPVNLWWDGLDGGGFPVDVGWDPRQLVYRDEQIRNLVETVGLIEVSGSGPSYTASFTLLDPDSEANATRYIFRKDRDSTFAVDCTMSVSSSELLLRITLPSVPDDRMVAVAVCFEDYRYEIFLNCSAREWFNDYSIRRDAEREVAIDRYAAGDTDVIELRLPSRVVEDCGTDGFMYGFMVIREQVQEWSRMTAGAAVPLRIRVPA